MVSCLWLVLACSEPPPAEEPPRRDPEAPSAPPADEPPRGSIGGEPILPHPTVVGGIDNAAVEASIAEKRPEIDRCWSDERAANPDLAGKVLVKFTIASDGTVTGTSTKSTSMRHAPTEECLNARVAQVKFPPLQSGRVAIVHYPFVFPPPESGTTTSRSPGR